MSAKRRSARFCLLGGKSLDIDMRTPGGPVWVRADAIAIDRLLLILLDNAIKYTPGRRLLRNRIARCDQTKFKSSSAIRASALRSTN